MRSNQSVLGKEDGRGGGVAGEDPEGKVGGMELFGSEERGSRYSGD